MAGGRPETAGGTVALAAGDGGSDGGGDGGGEVSATEADGAGGGGIAAGGTGADGDRSDDGAEFRFKTDRKPADAAP